jgi:DNA-binding NarL/FixJ family response regulator
MSTGSSSIRIMTANDHPLLRQGIATLINTQPDMKLIPSDLHAQVYELRRMYRL